MRSVRIAILAMALGPATAVDVPAEEGVGGWQTADEVEAELERRGFSNVRRLRQRDTIWEGTAREHGDAVRVMFDSETGEVRTWEQGD